MELDRAYAQFSKMRVIKKLLSRSSTFLLFEALINVNIYQIESMISVL